MKKAPAVAISVHAIAMALLLASWSALGQPADPAQWYASIQDLIGRDRKTGVSGTDRRSLDQFGERLASGGDPAIVFVVRKLRQMNDAEKISNPVDCVGALTSAASAENAPVKMELIRILAEAYRHAPAARQNDILRLD